MFPYSSTRLHVPHLDQFIEIPFDIIVPVHYIHLNPLKWIHTFEPLYDGHPGAELAGCCIGLCFYSIFFACYKSIRSLVDPACFYISLYRGGCCMEVSKSVWIGTRLGRNILASVSVATCRRLLGSTVSKIGFFSSWFYILF